MVPSQLSATISEALSVLSEYQFSQIRKQIAKILIYLQGYYKDQMNWMYSECLYNICGMKISA